MAHRMSDIGHFFKQNENAFYYSLILSPYKHSNSLFWLFQSREVRVLGDLGPALNPDLSFSYKYLFIPKRIDRTGGGSFQDLITYRYQGDGKRYSPSG